MNKSGQTHSKIGWNYIHDCSLQQIENLYTLPAGGGWLQFSSGCGKVNPPKVSNFKFKVISENSSEGKRWSLQRGRTRKRTWFNYHPNSSNHRLFRFIDIRLSVQNTRLKNKSLKTRRKKVWKHVDKQGDERRGWKNRKINRGRCGRPMYLWVKDDLSDCLSLFWRLLLLLSSLLHRDQQESHFLKLFAF